jgi:dynein light chain 1
VSFSSQFDSQIEKLEDVASTLEEVWVSYNQIATLDGLSCCPNLTTLYISNNVIKQWSELDKLVSFIRSLSFIRLSSN